MTALEILQEEQRARDALIAQTPEQSLSTANAFAAAGDRSSARFHAWVALSSAGQWNPSTMTDDFMHDHGAILRLANEVIV